MASQGQNRFADECAAPQGDEFSAEDASQRTEPTSDTGPAAARRVVTYLAELRDYAAIYASAKADKLKQSMRQIVLYAALGIIGLIAATAYIVTAVAVAILGMSEGLGHLFGERVWLGHLVTGLVLLSVLALVVYIMVRRMTSNSRRRTIEKYARRKQQHAARFPEQAGEQPVPEPQRK